LPPPPLLPFCTASAALGELHFPVPQYGITLSLPWRPSWVMVLLADTFRIWGIELAEAVFRRSATTVRGEVKRCKSEWLTTQAAEISGEWEAGNSARVWSLVRAVSGRKARGRRLPKVRRDKDGNVLSGDAVTASLEAQFLAEFGGNGTVTAGDAPCPFAFEPPQGILAPLSRE